jgi:dTDP-4-dehydrorhamnose reductase
MWQANALVPQICNAFLTPSTGFIHASTDAVFTTEKEDRRDFEAPDAMEPYGYTKRLGELGVYGLNRHIIRCSIIGIERDRPRSLLSSVLLQKDVKGFTNHYWNGITTLEWAKVCHDVITSAIVRPRIIQPGIWPAVSKYELIGKILEMFGSQARVSPVEAHSPVLRTLRPSGAKAIRRSVIMIRISRTNWLSSKVS